MVAKETEKRSSAMIKQLVANFNNQDSESLESTESCGGVNTEEETHKESVDEKETTFIWSDKAVMLFLEIYREREHEFTAGLKRHNKLWAEIASKLQKSNYNVSCSPK